MKKPVLSGARLKAEPFLAHAGRCQKDPLSCLVCRGALAFFNSQPLISLSEMLEDIMAPKMRISLGSVVVDRFIDRSNHVSKRATRDCDATAPILAAYQSAGGRID